MAFLGGLFGGAKKLFDRQEVPQNLDTRNPDVKRVQESLANFITSFLPQFKPGQPYGGQLSAPISGFETQGLGNLQRYLDQPDTTDLLPAAGQNVLQTLTGGFDPYNSKFFQAARDAALYNRQQAVDLTNRDLAGQNRFFSSERVNKIGDINAQTSNFLNQVLADLSEKERDRQISVLPQAQSLDREIMTAPLRKATAATTVGALPRELGQADLERSYQEFSRQRQEAALPLQAAGGFPTGNDLSFRAYQQSPFERFLLPLLQSLAGGVGAAFGGGF